MNPTMQLLRVLLVTVLILVAPIGAAQADDANNTAAAELVDEQARAYFKVGAFEDAAGEFARAYEIDRLPARLFNAGLAYEKAGNIHKASETYQKFLSVEGTGPKAVEARARKAALDKQIASGAQARSEAQAKQALEKQVQKHTRAANEHLRSGDYELAAGAFEEAYQIGKDPELLFDKAEALRLGGLATQALAAYRLYRRTAPDGINAAEARQKQTTLETAALGPTSLPSATVTTAAAPAPVANKKSSSLGWVRLGLGVGAIAAGVAADLIPESASNHKFDAVDLAPVALYGLGAGFLYSGVF